MNSMTLSEKKPTFTEKKVIIVGELHQDLFYRGDSFTQIANAIATRIKSKDLHDVSKENLEKEILKIIDDTPKKIGCEMYTKRGGNGNNSATLLAKLEVKTSLMTTIGIGTYWMLAELKNLGIDTQYIFQIDTPGPISTILEDPNITKILIAPQLKEKMNFNNIKIPNDAFRNAKIVFFTPIADKYTQVLEQVKNMDIFIAITIETQKIQTESQMKSICNVPADLLFVNLNDMAGILGFEINDNSESAVQHRIMLCEKKCQQIAHTRIYTLGKYGSWICTESKIINIPILPVQVKNRTGAGDTFAAAFIAYLYEHIQTKSAYQSLSIEERLKLLTACGQYASAAGALKVSTGEAPDKMTLTSFYNKNYNK